MSLEKGSDQLSVTLYTLYIYPSLHKQLIRTLFEAHIVVCPHLLTNPLPVFRAVQIRLWKGHIVSVPPLVRHLRLSHALVRVCYARNGRGEVAFEEGVVGVPNLGVLGLGGVPGQLEFTHVNHGVHTLAIILNSVYIGIWFKGSWGGGGTNNKSIFTLNIKPSLLGKTTSLFC